MDRTAEILAREARKASKNLCGFTSRGRKGGAEELGAMSGAHNRSVMAPTNNALMMQSHRLDSTGCCFVGRMPIVFTCAQVSVCVRSAESHRPLAVVLASWWLVSKYEGRPGGCRPRRLPPEICSRVAGIAIMVIIFGRVWWPVVCVPSADRAQLVIRVRQHLNY